VLFQEEDNPMLVGQTLRDRYYLVREIGAGAFGRTYQVEDRQYRSNVLCVVKHLQPQIPAEYKQPEERAEFLRITQDLFRREMEALEKLGKYSGQIPTLLDFFEENDQFYLVQEWIDGKPLSELLPIGTKITQKEAIALLIEILEPLVFCHEEQVVHRDLKPDNIMRRNADSRIEPNKLALIDFGAVKEVSTSVVMNPQVMSRMIGTMGFMPTEQIKGRPCFASDVYAVGMIGVQALTGVSAHWIEEDADTEEVLWRSGTSYDGRAYQCYTTPEFGVVLGRMVKRKQGDRYANAAEALAALRSLPIPQVTASAPVLSNPAGEAALVPDPVPSMPELPKVPPNPQKFSFEVATVELQTVVKKQPSLWQKEVRKRELKTRKENKQAEFVTEDLGNGVKLEMVCIPGGSFTMGSSDNEKDHQPRESPQHLVMVPAFWMGKYPVTQSQYLAIMGKNPSHFQGGDLPVELVSWRYAQEFCARLSEQTGKLYRLPSEAEWEYACRAGTTTPFHFGETISSDLANFDGNYSYGDAPKGKYLQKTSPVGSYKVANDFGLYDMHGNVWEWCEDLWHENYQGAPIDGSAWIEGDYRTYVLRGGSWDLYPCSCRSAYRLRDNADDQVDDVGFRVVYARARIL
jgi:eukaryotic-like serine/threonine-protein kinase